MFRALGGRWGDLHLSGFSEIRVASKFRETELSTEASGDVPGLFVGG